VNEDDLKQQHMLNLTDEQLSKVWSHHRSVLDTNDKGKEWRADVSNVNHRNEEDEGWKLLQRC
jgi:hypothetical protein